MSTFNTEIWDQGLLSQGPSASGKTTPENTTDSKKPGIVYRIFHMGDSTPTENGSMWGRSRRSYGSGSEQESSEEDSDDNSSRGSRRSSLVESIDKFKKAVSGKSGSQRGVFSMGGEDSSDYESDDMEEAPRKARSSIFKDLLTVKRTRH